MSLLTFRFRHSRSDELPWLIELAKRGEFSEQILSPKQIVYETAFHLLDHAHLSTAISLATALVKDKKAEAFMGRHTLKIANVRDVLTCYQHSLQLAVPQAYCWLQRPFTLDAFGPYFNACTRTFDGDPDEEPPKQPFIFPCKLAANRSHTIHPSQPGAILDQTEAALVRAETRWCPRLDDLTAWAEAQTIEIGYPRITES